MSKLTGPYWQITSPGAESSARTAEHGTTTLPEPVIAAPAGPAPRSRASRWLWNAAHLGMVAAACALWLSSLPAIDPDRISDYGLVTALPPQFYAALVLLTVSFCTCVARRDQAQFVLALHPVALVVILHATLPLVYDAPRYAYLYKHLGVVEYIAQHRAVDTTIDIYHNWPGFFVLAATIASAADLLGTVDWAAWAQPVTDLLYLTALVFIFRSLTTDRRIVWLATWLFFAANWIGQDYFSPQGFSYWLYLLVIGICLSRLRSTPLAPAPRWLRPRFLADAYRGLVNRSLASSPHPGVPSRGQRAVDVVIVLCLFGGIVVSHQLTPFTVLAGVGLLVVFRWIRPWFLPVVMAAMIGAWLLHTLPFVSQVQEVTSGSLVSNATSSLASLEGESTARVVVAMSSRVLTGAMWALAAVGLLRRLRRGHWDLPVVLLAAAPTVLLFNVYGGEILMRISFFALPWVAFLAAGAFYPHVSDRATVRKTVAAILTSSLLLGTLLFAYYGLERANHIRSGEVAAARWFYDNVEPGSLLMLTAPNFPTRLTARYYEYPGFDYDVSMLQYAQFQGRPLGREDAVEVANVMAEWRVADAYLMFSASQTGYAELHGLTPRGALEDLEAAVAASNRFRVVYENDDATLYRLVPLSDVAQQATQQPAAAPG